MSRLLVIDDERAFGEFVAKVAVMLGFEAEVTDATPAFRKRLNEWQPSVLVIDLQMPEVDGIELLRELSDQGCRSRIVLASGVDSRTLRSASHFGQELGLAMAGEVRKPIRATALKALLAGLRGSVDVIAAEAGDEPVTLETLAEAITGGRLFLEFQPQVTVPDRRFVGVEALVRWRSASGRMIGPDAFIPLAERSGLIDDLTAWVIEAAVRQAGRWRSEGRDFKVSVNLSARNIHDRRLPDLLAERCRLAAVPPEGLVLELTETATMQDAAMLMEVLGRFRLKGFPLSIDDFGTGYSSIAQLLRLPFSELKVDKSFVTTMDRVHESAVVTRTVIDMAHHLGLPVVAEGVETEEAFILLSEFGCDFAQGYLVSRPVGADVIASFPAVL